MFWWSWASIPTRLKGQGQLWHSACKTLWTRCRLQFLSNHFHTSHVSGGWWEKEPYWFWVTGSKVKVNFCTLCIRPYGHNTDYSLYPISFKLRMYVMDDEGKTLLILGLGVIGQGQLFPPARGCHALRCLVTLLSVFINSIKIWFLVKDSRHV